MRRCTRSTSLAATAPAASLFGERPQPFAVRVLPETDPSVDLLIQGTILRSDGANLILQVRASDSSGREWLNRTYADTAGNADYPDFVPSLRDRSTTTNLEDPFQDLHAQIANDLLAVRETMDSSALLALAHRRRQQPGSPHDLRPLRQQPVRRRRKPKGSLMARGNSSTGSWIPWLGLALIILIADQFTKVLILGYYKLGDSTYVWPFFNVVRAHNTGAAFSFLASASGWQRWLFTGIGIVATIFIVWMLRSHAGQKLFSFALACILGGAIGNVVDRVVHVIVVHLGLIPASRVRQITQLLAFIAREIPHDAPVLVAGDFNDWGRRVSLMMQGAGLVEWTHSRALTYPSRLPIVQLDHVYVRGLRPTGVMVPHGRIWRQMSDHLPLVAEFQFN